MTNTGQIKTTQAPSPRFTGFTLVELLVSGALGAILLGALAVTSFTFTESLLEIEGEGTAFAQGEDALGRITREIREAHLAEIPSSGRLRLRFADGTTHEYFREEDDLLLRRNNGDTARIFLDLDDIVFVPTLTTRRREDPPEMTYGIWLPHEDFAVATGPWQEQLPNQNPPLEIFPGHTVSLGFVPPTSNSVLGGNGNEQLLQIGLSLLSVPVASMAPSSSVLVSLYETRGPGSAIPVETPLGSFALPMGALPQALPDGAGGWVAPQAMTTIDLSPLNAAMEPGVGYALVLAGSGGLVFSPTLLAGNADLAIASPGGPFATVSSTVPFSLSGECVQTHSVEQDVIVRVTIKMTPSAGPPVTRSASLLSQTLSKDPWLGVVPGEAAP